MLNNDKRSGIKIGLGVAIVGFALAWLLGIAHNNDQANKDKLAELHSAELSACWERVSEEGGTCRIEYLKDRTDTVYGARVVYDR